jgi:type IX secretion system PorP/SprF family membrane protein
MIRRIVILLVLVTISLTGVAQDTEQTQTYLNLAGSNAGFTGFEDFLDTRFAYRQGWNNFQVQNNYVYLSANSALNNRRRALGSNALRTSNPNLVQEIQSSKKVRRKHGAGGMLSSRNLGPYKLTTLQGNYAYHLPISERINWSMGTKIGIAQQGIDFSNYTVRDEINDMFYQELIASGQGKQASVMMDFGTVVYSDKFYVGVHSTNMIRSTVDGESLLASDRFKYFSLQASIIRISVNHELVFSPFAELTYANNYPLTWSLMGRLRYKELINAGLGYSNRGNKLSFNVGLTPNTNFSINYAFDRYLGDLGTFKVSVHEIVLGAVLFNKYGNRARLW